MKGGVCAVEGVVHIAWNWELLLAIRGARRCRGAATAGIGSFDRNSA